MSDSSYEFIRSKGLHIEIDGEDLLLSPAEKVTQEVRDFAKTHKTQIIKEYLDHIEAMSLDVFASAEIAVKIYSRVLGEDVYLCSSPDLKAMVSGEGFTCYLPQELQEIMQGWPDSETLRTVHNLKATFDGKIKKGQCK